MTGSQTKFAFSIRHMTWVKAKQSAALCVALAGKVSDQDKNALQVKATASKVYPQCQWSEASLTHVILHFSAYLPPYLEEALPHCSDES